MRNHHGNWGLLSLGILALALSATAAQAAPAATASAAVTPEIFKSKGCIQCHKVSYYGIEGGETGPDLSMAYTDVNERFGTTLDKFLKKPTGTMQMVLGSMIKLSDDEKKGIYKLLKEASQKNAHKK